MAKKLISCLVALTLVLGLAAFSVSADEPILTIAAGDKTVALGQDVVVEVAITAPAKAVRYFAFDGSWNKDDLTYKSYELKEITADTSFNVNEENGTFEYATLNDNNADATFTDTVILEITFTAKDTIVGTSYDTTLTLTKKSDADEAYVGGDIDMTPIASADVATSNATITLLAAHTAPTVTPSIEGSGKVGEVLTAGAEVVDSWSLTPTSTTYEWSKIVDEETVVLGEEETYTPSKDDLGAEITLTVTATVEADDNPTGTGTATITVIKNDSYKPTATLVSAPASVEAGEDITVTFSYEDKNGIEFSEELSKATAYFFEEGQLEEEGGDDEVTIDEPTLSYAGGTVKVTVKTTDKMIDKEIVVELVPANEDEEVGEAVKTETPVKVTEVTRRSKGSSGSKGASLVPGKNDANTNTNNNGEANNNGEENNKPSKSYPKESIVLTIGDKEVGVFGETITNDVAPKIVKDRTMLPARLVAEKLGATVGWDGETRTVTITKGAVSIIITIDSDKAIVNGEEVELDSPAFIENDRTYTPMRFIAEALNANVEWDDATKVVTITPGK